ncbi:MAG TPA: (2Fe-2S)-binding protein [Thermodesulfobacteriota bacterium]|nr:(2Fe-2S)-binding protein [Thermodesulfobacteriota bacterium]
MGAVQQQPPPAAGAAAPWRMTIRVTVNGRRHELAVEPRETLLEVIRERLGLTGAKRSCDMQVCGACTVLLDGRPVSACTLLAVEARDREVLTIEGLERDGRLHPLQEAFIEHGGFQCGFCTPGMILTAKALLDENPRPTVEEVKHFMRGNICRCTGYKKILESILAAAERLAAERTVGGAAAAGGPGSGRS